MTGLDCSSPLAVETYLAYEAAHLDQRPLFEYDGCRAVEREDSSLAHVLITSNLVGLLASVLRPLGYRMASVMLRLKTITSYRYPDVVAYCPPADFTDERPPSLRNPVLLVEVLSDTTAETDFTLKLKEYTSIPSVQEYWVVAQDTAVIYRYTRGTDAWMLHVHNGLEATITSEALGVSVPLADVYEGVDFSPPAPASAAAE